MFFPWLQAVVRIDVVFRNVDPAGVVSVGSAELLQRDLSLPRKKPVDEHFRRVGMRSATRDAQGSASRARAAALFPAFGVEGSDGQSLVFGFADLASRVATNTKGKFSRPQPVGHLTRIATHGNLHFAVEFSQKGRTQIGMVVQELKRRSHAESGGIERGHFTFPPGI